MKKIINILKADRYAITVYLIAVVIFSIFLSFLQPVTSAITDSIQMAGNVFWYYLFFPEKKDI